MHKINIYAYGQGMDIEFDTKTPKQLIVMRGIPGSGKSYVTRLFRDNPKIGVVSTDEWFTNEQGEYHFNPAELGVAHADCFRRFVAHIDKEKPTVVVDNTNLRAYEYAPYLTYGAAYGYETLLLSFWVPFAVAERRQTHGVPGNVLLGMWSTFSTEVVPGHYTHKVIVNDYEPREF